MAKIIVNFGGGTAVLGNHTEKGGSALGLLSPMTSMEGGQRYRLIGGDSYGK